MNKIYSTSLALAVLAFLVFFAAANRLIPDFDALIKLKERSEDLTLEKALEKAGVKGAPNVPVPGETPPPQEQAPPEE